VTTYTAITNSQIDQDSPGTQPLFTALRDNPIAIADGSAGAPFLSAGWHNYDGAQALTAIYDFAIAGSVATVVSPDFADGWEYLFLFDEITTSAGGSTDDFRVEFYRATSAAYAGASTVLTDASNAIVRGQIVIYDPRRTAPLHRAEYVFRDGSASNSNSLDTNASDLTFVNGSGGVAHTTAQKLLRARFGWVSGNINGGKIFMARRQVGYTR
jgi:hypothetical protein